MEIPVFIFSFNRGKFLENCVQSIESNFPASSIFIMDDNSDDTQTIKILENLKERATVYNNFQREGNSHVGGLHSNMNNALDICESLEESVALFMQDDQQVVRSVSETEIEKMQSFFDMGNSSFVIQTCFMKKEHKQASNSLIPYGDFFRRDCRARGLEAGNCAYSDTGIFSISRCRETLGEFSVGESTNEERARKLGLQLGFLHTPFMHYLPFPISYRKRGRSWSTRWADRLAGAGIHSFSTMDVETLARLHSRERASLAYAEDWLVAPTAPKAEIWPLTGGMANLVHRGGWREKLVRIYTKLRLVI